MNIKLCPIKIFKLNLYLILFLLLAGILSGVSKIYLTDHYLYGLIPLFDLDHERNIPTFYSTFALIAASILLFFITCACKSLKLSYAYWLHLKVSGVFYRAWIIPYGIALAVFVVIYVKFLFSLPKNIIFLFIFAGTIFVVGVIGFEILGGLQKQLFGVNNILYTFYYICEELFEMVGIAIFNYALLLYIVDYFEPIMIETKEGKKEK
ncbi:MAG: hypothetical protein P8Y35_07405 [Sulfurovaceae bacterium]